MTSNADSPLASGKQQKRKKGKGATEEFEKLRKDMDMLQAELQKFKELAARAQADLQNAKMRVERERSEVGAFATEEVLRRILPTLDNFRRAFVHLPSEFEGHEWVKGLRATEQEFFRQLEAVGLKRMSSADSLVDPSKHEVLMTGPGEAGKILEVFEEGYELNGKVLRPAKVRVGQEQGSSSV